MYKNENCVGLFQEIDRLAEDDELKKISVYQFRFTKLTLTCSHFGE